MSSLNASSFDGQAGEFGERAADPGGAGDLAERADMRQAGGAIAGLEQRGFLARSGEALGDFARFLERPGLRDVGRVVADCIGHGRKLWTGLRQVNRNHGDPVR